MAPSYTPAARQFGRRIRLAYTAVLVLMLCALLWIGRGVHGFVAHDAEHATMVSIAGRMRGLSTEVVHVTVLKATAPQVATDMEFERSIQAWIDQHAMVGKFLSKVCTRGDPLCQSFEALTVRMRAAVASARVAVVAPAPDRIAALGRLEVLRRDDLVAAKAWVAELTDRFAAEAAAQQRELFLWAVSVVLAVALLSAIVLERVIRRLQRERSDVDLGVH